MSAVPAADDYEFPPISAYSSDRSFGLREGSRSDGVATQGFLAQRIDEIESAPRAAIVQGLGFDRAAVAALVGAPNAGKTAFAISLAVHLAARAERWLGLKTAGGPVLYFGSEAPGSVIMRTRAAASRIQAKDVPFYISTAVPGLGGASSAVQDADRIIATIRDIESAEGETVVVVFIDTLAACLADGDENGEGMLRMVVGAKRIATTTGALVVLIHHPSKGDSASLRGHGSLAAACDSIVRIEIEESVTGVRAATLMKARDCSTGVQLRFELEQVILEDRDSFGDPRSTVVVRATTQPAPRKRPSAQRQRQLLDELERRYRTGERAWDEATVRKAGRTLGMHRNTPLSALRGLIKGGYLVGASDSLRLKDPPEDPV